VCYDRSQELGEPGHMIAFIYFSILVWLTGCNSLLYQLNMHYFMSIR
jgi:hypothetical protein